MNLVAVFTEVEEGWNGNLYPRVERVSGNFVFEENSNKPAGAYYTGRVKNNPNYLT